jgi:hypothetical protein
MDKNKTETDEGIKMGPTDSVSLQREDGNTTAAAKKGIVIPSDELTGEKDADDMVHEPHSELPTDGAELDIDEIVHEEENIRNDKAAEDEQTEEEDMDELVHRTNSTL